MLNTTFRSLGVEGLEHKAPKDLKMGISAFVLEILNLKNFMIIGHQELKVMTKTWSSRSMTT